MPSVTDNTDILEPTSHSAECDYTRERTQALPASWRGRPSLLLALRGWFIPLLRLHMHQEQTCARRMPQQPTMSIDLLARKYPAIYRRITSWSI
jgi:hypothetical protein